MTDATEIERLVEWLRYGKGVKSWWMLGAEAADLIEAQAADNARLRAQPSPQRSRAMGEPITVTTEVRVRRWQVPNFAVQDMPPRPRQEGFTEAPKLHVRELPHQVLDALAGAWLDDLYSKAGQRNPFAAKEPNDD